MIIQLCICAPFTNNCVDEDDLESNSNTMTRRMAKRMAGIIIEEVVTEALVTIVIAIVVWATIWECIIQWEICIILVVGTMEQRKKQGQQAQAAATVDEIETLVELAQRREGMKRRIAEMEPFVK